MKKFAAIVISVLACAYGAEAALQIPDQLNERDRGLATEILGFGSASKILSNPFPLGGYSGVEVGLSTEFIGTEDLSRLGSKTSSKDTYNYSILSLGKGLYNDVDLFFQFAPVTQNGAVNNYGGQLRWAFYQATFFPTLLSLVVHANSTNFQQKIVTQTFGADLIMSVNVDYFGIFFGLGQAKAQGTFIGGADGITDTGNTETASLNQTHTVMGASVKLSQLFFAVEMDRYTQPYYGMKIGMRF